MLKKGWLKRQLVNSEKEIEKWPSWMRREAGLEQESDMTMNEIRHEKAKRDLAKSMKREVELTAANTLYLQILRLAARRLRQGQAEIKEALDIYGSVLYDSHGLSMAANPLTQQFFENNQSCLSAIEAVFPHEEQEPVSRFGPDAQMKALADILAERKAQDAKWGYVENDPTTWASILMEEVGEMCQDINQGDDYQGELVQVAAVAMSWLEAIECKATQCPGEPT